MLSEKNSILEFNQYIKSNKMPYIIYADIGFLIFKKIDRCANNPENSLTTKLGEHIRCGYSMSTILAFDHLENKHNLFRGKDCMKKFCTSLRKQAKDIIDFEKKSVIFNKRRIKSRQDAKAYYICGKRILKKLSQTINYLKVRDHCHYTSNIEVQHIVLVI